MANKTRKVLQPEYMKKFHCIGANCEDICCGGWRIVIDKDTYQKYRECPDKDLRKQLKEHVTRIRTDADDTNYAKIKLNPDDGSCPLLDGDKLCSVQRKFGEGYLSLTCTAYPRLTNIVNGVSEKALTVSCPEAARIVLLNPEVMSFDETEEDASIRNAITKTIETDDFRLAHSGLRHFWEVRIFIISLLQNRAYKLWQRMVILGLFCRSLDQLISEGKFPAIPKLIGTYLDHLDSGVFRDELNNIPNEFTIQMKLMKEVADQRIFSGSVNEHYYECFAEFLEGIQYISGTKVEDIGKNYVEAHDKYYHPFMDAREYIMENYLVNDVFSNLFPFKGGIKVFDNYVIFVVNYSMIKMLLIGMAGLHKEKFNIDHVIKLIQSFAKVISHDENFLKGVIELLKDNNFNTMPYMAILLKS
ncbi:flagellin lysine-N-methylase [Sporomusa sp.]|uniref:flagellin lysine-N-methylase n=1 Tax=Sporomusa sp. TaxID=2078658 RepID=UPI002C1C33AF|nr:flagellin lysine-N-methylase [Sporomusa sp.]HWR45764.1 flagellin lysine-N-methylase [Sporomusa sp.]